MSDGQKKTGTRDLSDLKARLGMLNKNVGGAAGAQPRANPFSPQPAQGSQGPGTLDVEGPSADSTQAVPAIDDGGALEESTSVHDAINFDGGDSTQQVPSVAEAAAAAAPTPAPAAPAAPATPAPAAPAPAAAAGFNPLGLGSDLFKKPEPAPEPVAPAPIAQAPAAQAPAAQAPFAQAPIPQAPIPQAPAPQPEPARPESAFANPLQMGSVGNAAPPVDLSADEEEALAAFEGGVGKANKRMLFGIMGVSLVLGLGFGFMSGTVRGTRQLVNVQIEHARQVEKNMGPVLDQLDEMIALVEGLDPNNVNWAQVELIPTELSSVQVGSVIGGRYLSQKLMNELSVVIVGANDLFKQLADHRRVSLRDKPQIEAEAKGDTFAQNNNFAVVYTPPDPKNFRIPRGRLVAVVAQEESDDGTKFKVRYQKGTESLVAPANVIAMDRKEVVRSGGNNTKLLYTNRVKELREKAQALLEPSKNLRKQLKQEAARETVSVWF